MITPLPIALLKIYMQEGQYVFFLFLSFFPFFYHEDVKIMSNSSLSSLALSELRTMHVLIHTSPVVLTSEFMIHLVQAKLLLWSPIHFSLHTQKFYPFTIFVYICDSQLYHLSPEDGESILFWHLSSTIESTQHQNPKEHNHIWKWYLGFGKHDLNADLDTPSNPLEHFELFLTPKLPN